MALNTPSQRFPFNVTGKCEPEVEAAIKNTFNGLADHEQAISALAPQSGPTSSRPTTNIKTGQQFYDSTLGIPIVWTGNFWVNYQGTQV